MPERRTVALVTLGCARNEVDSEELAGRLEADGWELVTVTPISSFAGDSSGRSYFRLATLISPAEVRPSFGLADLGRPPLIFGPGSLRA